MQLIERLKEVRREITYITCTPCEERTGKEVNGIRVVVDGIIYDVCPKDRKIIDQYKQFRDRYGQRTPRAAHNGHPQRKTRSARSYQCGTCKEDGVAKIVALNSRPWHAGHYHDAKASEIEWHEV